MLVSIVIPLLLIVFFAFTTEVTVDAKGNRLDDEALNYLASFESDGEDEDEEDLAAEAEEDLQEVRYVRESGEDAVIWLPLAQKTVFTLKNLLTVSDYMAVMMRSVWLALLATVLCLLIAYPISFMISRMPAGRQKIVIMLTMLPMWMNFLLRTYAWMTLLERNGWINKLLGLVGIGPLQMINTEGAVILGMVYNYLPFMILPLYSIMTKIGRSTIEAAEDLGASRLHVFARVVFPLSLPGVTTGITMVFVPAISTFIISRMLGGGTNMLIGDLIDLQFLGNAYNPNLGAAMSLVLMVFVLLCMSITNRLDGEDNMQEGVM